MSFEDKKTESKRAGEESEQILQNDSERVIDSKNLFGERQEITICHNGECYRLRKTKTGKLILNK